MTTSHSKDEVDSLIETIETMKDDLALIGQLFDNAVDSRPELKEYKDAQGLSS
tara:strand:+ start:351 stop:509 length:159 start_codon:yes stop_codon:yes gene_type:complete